MVQLSGPGSSNDARMEGSSNENAALLLQSLTLFQSDMYKLMYKSMTFYPLTLQLTLWPLLSHLTNLCHINTSIVRHLYLSFFVIAKL